MIHVISLGAGVQSSTMALMAAHGEITPMPDCAIFADVGAEPNEVYFWLKYLCGACKCVGCPDCNGTGRVWVRTGGYPEDDSATCDYCSGSGITESCDRCQELEELEDAFSERPA